MHPRQYFPLGKAYGEAFCNRTQETKTLTGNIKNGKHTFLVAPRRYGKSSLCEHALKKVGIPYIKVDLFIATSEKNVERLFLKAVIDLIGKAVGRVDRIIESTKYTFKHLKPKFAFEASGLKFELDVAHEASVPESIQEALLLLDKLLVYKQKHAAMLIDEFQRVAEIAPDKGIEAGIRSAAQETNNLALIFSGSHRHIIESIFQDEGRPLYKLCKKIKLKRISETDYRHHLNKAAEAMWGCFLEEAVFSEIVQVTERHPYYMNYLCDYLWSEDSPPVQPKIVEETWHLVVEEEKSDLLRDYYAITENQKKLLKYIANHPGESIYSVQAAQTMEMPTTSVPSALYVLLNQDLVEAYMPKKYRVINPLYKKILGESI